MESDIDRYKRELGVPAEHELVETHAEREQRRGQDADIYWFDEVDTNGAVVKRHKLRDSISIYPPNTRTITVE
ncbi:hypothetical protein [Pseudomonas aeruginosa]|uniref:hypothetical protein n=1 Tax=Pseudomonas aeruginosa TaxID=287 RepID=UPI001F4B3D70|nr:hypothetical protein [Pseudomonas aeruginosa]MBX5606231.1 hypothetical protein [Pseudomonas aeruginosa]MCV3803599.1 hypothetical protein [Pseudomonas aeruginosa]MCV3845670.1 hypothetical protein [Pseudomonas aeruginosa]MCV3863662.1 hypothetical protein [Pseudomonas aeruginosa]MCV3982750.1 hypothetical protein [Pseudomonas aeruginosa]